MSQDSMDTTDVITTTNKDKSPDISLMNYTAVTSHPAMAEAFIDQLLRMGNHVIPDHELTAEDLLKICQVSLERRDEGISVEEGRDLRRRVDEQVSRADRYSEPFSMIILKLQKDASSGTYDSVVDTLCERMRQTDFIFLFKTRIALILPHTLRESREILKKRICELLETAIADSKSIEFAESTYPDPSFKKGSDVLDWSEDQLRT